MSGKRKRVVLDLSKKMEIIKRLKKGESATKIAPIYGIARTTVNDIKKDADKIEKHVSKMQSSDGNTSVRKTMKCSSLEQLDTAVYQWFIQARSEGVPLSGPIIQGKAMELHKKMNGDPAFQASTGWLHRFKNRHGIRQLDISGEKLSSNSSIVVEYKQEFSAMVNSRKLVREQVYNCDETGLNWKALPDKTLATMSEKSAPGFKMQKDRITVMVCSNASGSHKLPLFVLGKSKNPRAFKNLNMNALPVNYSSQKNAWMSQDIFITWFHNIFVPSVRSHLEKIGLPSEAMLFMDNAPTHPNSQLKSDCGKITCHFLPANTTALIQPMDQGVIESMKRRYRRGFIQQLVTSGDKLNIKDFWKKYTIKDAVYNIAQAWNDLPSQTLQRAWNKLWPQENEDNTDTETHNTDNEEILQLFDALPGGENIEIDDVTAWMDLDKQDAGFQLLSDDDIIQQVLDPKDPEEDDESDHEVVEAPKTISHTEAEAMFSKCIDWFEQQSEADSTQLLLLRRLRDLAAKKARNVLTQKKLTDFFKQ